MDDLNLNLPPALEDALKRYYAAPEPTPAFTAKLNEALSRRQSELTQPQRKTLMQRRPILVLALTLLALLLLTGVVYAVGNWLRYIYVPQANTFMPAENTLVIKQPVRQDHNGRTATVTQGTANAHETFVWVEFSDAAQPVDGATLKTSDGREIKLNYWEYTTSAPSARGIRMRFDVLPAGTSAATLSLPEGWQIPLTWVSLAAAQTPESDVASAPYPATVVVAEPTAEMSCITARGLQLCVLNATQSEGKTVMLVQAKSIGGNLTPGSQNGTMLLWQDETTPITLVDSQGKSLPLEAADPVSLVDSATGAAAQLTFTGIPAADQPAKLVIPGFYVSEPLNQSVTVDLGDDPQPGPLLVNADLQTFGQTVRFRKGTMLGDGTSSLRLYLDSEPVGIVDGIQPDSLEMGRPDRVDDLFGAGNLAGSKDLSVELFQYGKKLTGKLTLPIIRANGIVHGPFSFNVALSAPLAATATPIVADPNTFSPAPTSTPLALDSYAYTGTPLNPGDLLYTLLNGDKTQVYAFTPGAQSRLLVTLPGGVSQISLHADRLGLDYLAGEAVTRDDVSFFDVLRLYTVRFDAPKPRLLYNFAPNGQNFLGTGVIGDWSFDGRYAVFSVFTTTQSVETISSSSHYVWFDLACRADVHCQPHDLVIPSLESIDSVRFSPNENKILFSALKNPDMEPINIFIWDFDPQKAAAPVNIAENLSVAELAQPPAWAADGKIFTICGDSVYSETSTFCTIDPVSHNINLNKPFNPNLNGSRLLGNYQLAPSGKQIAAILTPINDTRSTIPELRLLDLDGHPGPVIAASTSLATNFQIVFSPSSQYLGYIFENGQKLEIFDTLNSVHIPVYNGQQAGAVSWLGWVK